MDDFNLRQNVNSPVWKYEFVMGMMIHVNANDIQYTIDQVCRNTSSEK